MVSMSISQNSKGPMKRASVQESDAAQRFRTAEILTSKADEKTPWAALRDGIVKANPRSDLIKAEEQAYFWWHIG